MNKKLLVFSVLSLAACWAQAFKFADVLTDHAVLQRDLSTPVWGEAKPGDVVTVTLNGTKVGESVTDKDGRWLVRLPPQKANRQPSEITATCQGETVKIGDILFGDVWFGCGQSNMAFKFKSFDWKAVGATNFVQQANKDDIRILLMDVPNTGFTQKDAPCVRWKRSDPNDPTSVANFGAALYWMGDKLEAELGVPIGLVDSSWGMTRINGWLDPAYCLAKGEPATKGIAQEYEKTRARWFDQGGAAEYAEKEFAWNAKYYPIANCFPWSPKWKAGDKNVFEAGFTCEDCVSFKLPIANFRTEPFPKDFSAELWLRGEWKLSKEDLEKGDEWFVKLDCFGRSAAWVNGTKVGETYEDNPGYLIPKQALREGVNVVAILFKAWNPAFKLGGVYSPLQINCTGAGTVATVPELTASWSKSAPKDDQPAQDPRKAIVFTKFSMHNGLVAPLYPMGIKGAVWYQGCSDMGNGGYGDMLKSLIGGWREGFTYQGKLPVIITEIAPHDTNGKTADKIAKGEVTGPVKSCCSAAIRDIQQKVGAELSDCATVSLLDLGEPDIHPCRKQPVGLRWARWALASVYGKDLVPNGPTVATVDCKGGTAKVSFRNAKGLKTSDGKAPKGFEVAGPDGNFVWANARIEGETIVVSAPSVTDIKSVRYAWFDLPLGWNVVNGEDLPLGVFSAQ